MRVSVIGLGRVGLPHALVSADSGNIVYGVDINTKLIKNLKRAVTPFYEHGLRELLEKYVGKNFFPVTNLEEGVNRSEVIVVMVGTRATKSIKKLDLSNFLGGIIERITRCGIKGKTLIIRTTLPIGTTSKIKAFIESKTGLKEGNDFHVVYCPERAFEGTAVKDERTLPNIVGAYNDEGFRIAKQYFDTIGSETVRVSSPEAAESIKLIENAYRQLIFAFSNDVALLAEEVGIDATEVIKVANYNYPWNNIPLPSYGVSGYCLTKDPYFLEHAFNPIKRRRGFNSVWYYGRLTNDYLPKYVVWLIEKFVTKCKKGADFKVLVAGITFKDDVDDVRLSHGLEIIEYLPSRCKISIYDPYVKGSSYDIFSEESKRYSGKALEIFTHIDEAFVGQDVVIFTVRHKEFQQLRGEKIRKLVNRMRKPAIVIDGWNLFPELRGVKDILYRGVGCG